MRGTLLGTPVFVAVFMACVPPLVAACGDGAGGVGEMREMMRMMGGRNMELPEGIAASELPDPGGRGAGLVATYDLPPNSGPGFMPPQPTAR